MSSNKILIINPSDFHMYDSKPNSCGVLIRCDMKECIVSSRHEWISKYQSNGGLTWWAL